MSYKTQVYRFWTEFKPDPDDSAKLVPVDWVEYGPIGLGDRVRMTEKISRLRAARPRDPNDGVNDGAVNAANDRWDFIRPLYERWKAGQDLPEVGTPLAAWNAVTPEQAEIFKMHGIKTVENIAGMTDSDIQRIPLPGLRKTVEAAKLFLAAQDQTRAASDLARKDEEISNLKTQMAELLELVKANAKTGVLEPMKRKGGRPPGSKNKPKVEAAA